MNPPCPTASPPAFALSMHVGQDAQTLPLPLTTHRPLTQSSLPSVSPLPARLQLARIRFHLLNSRARESAENERRGEADKRPEGEPRRRNYSAAERRSRSDRLKNLWSDPEWRERVLAKRRDPDVIKKISEASKNNWQDAEFRERMRASRIGRAAPNKGQPASKVTRMRMSLSRKGVPTSSETRKKMSLAKLNRPDDDDWPRLISQSKKGKTKEYFAMKREFRALHHDLMLWSDTYRAKHGKLPSAATYERFVAPMMIFRIKRYLMLKEAIGEDEPQARDIISD